MYTTICKSYNCHNCGTVLNRIGNIFKCPYCGAIYVITEKSDVAVEIEQTKDGLDVLNVKRIIDNEFIDYWTVPDDHWWKKDKNLKNYKYFTKDNETVSIEDILDDIILPSDQCVLHEG